MHCLSCGAPLKPSARKFCSNRCQGDHAFKTYIAQWRAGLVSGKRGVRAQNLSKHILRYLAEKYGQQCSRCAWHEVNPVTGRVPLEVDHIDGRADNNAEANLRLLCPNCHSLTPDFRNLNRGNGRKWRRDKYSKHTHAALAQLARASVL